MAELAAGGGGAQLSFEAKPHRYYALGCKAESATDAVADNVHVHFDNFGDSGWYEQALEEAKGSVFQRGSDMGRRFLRRTSPVETAGLISAETATIADPVSQMCTASQLEEPEYDSWLERIGLGKHWHRKQWEFIYIVSVLRKAGVLQPGCKGLGFGCGTEFLPSFFAAQGLKVLATDVGTDERRASGWIETGQHSSDVEQLHWPSLCSMETLKAQVSFRQVDMNSIPKDLTGFDFCWSACALEHLGSIGKGLAFIGESLRCLRPGGVAVHTTELNLSSNHRTVDHEQTVLFRRRDIEKLALRLTRQGHHVLPIKYDQGSRPLDTHVDVPPYSHHNHLKLALRQFVTTSFGLAVIKKG